MSEIELTDAILRNSLQILRLSAGEQAAVEQILRELERELKALLDSRTLSGSSKREVERLISDAGRAIDGGYTQAGAQLDTHALALIVAEQTAELIGETIPGDIARPTDTTLASLTRDVLIEGSPASAWWARQSEDTAFRFAGQVRQGIINGETNERIVGRIVGRKPRGDDPGEPGIMDLIRRNARALVHSSVMSAANAARFASFRKNPDLFAGVRWLATLDGITCNRCAALDGQSWDLDGKKLKGTKVAFLAPPIHWNDRCVLSPIPKRTALEEAFPGISAELDEAGARASSLGPLPAKTTFQDFLKRQTPEFVEATLGKRRAELFQAGKITVRDLVSGTGRELTLEELRIRKP